MNKTLISSRCVATSHLTYLSVILLVSAKLLAQDATNGSAISAAAKTAPDAVLAPDASPTITLNADMGTASSFSVPTNCFDAGDRLETSQQKQVLLRRADAIVLKFKSQGNAKDRAAAFRRVTTDLKSLAGGGVVEEHGDRHTVVKLPVELREKLAFRDYLAQVRSHADVASADPVFVDGESSLGLLCLPELILAPKPGVAVADLIGKRAGGMRLLTCTSDQYIISMLGMTAEEIIAEANRLSADARVLWAHPNFTCELKHGQVAMPNDPGFSLQWHLRNTGQTGTGSIGGTPDADVAALYGWQYGQGNNHRTVAVLDNGVQLDHPDLQNVRAINTADLGNDEDHNGFVNDRNGWDFIGVPPNLVENNDPSPKGTGDDHGTAVAGAVAAEVSNGTGVAGIGRNQRVLPVKISYQMGTGTTAVTYSTSASLAAALRYAAGSTRDGLGRWAGADLINLSFSIAKDPAIDSALDWATHFGRGGLGSTVVASSGNGATSQPSFRQSIVPLNPITGTGNTSVSVRWQYEKDASIAAGDDATWLDSVTFERQQPDQTWSAVTSEDFSLSTFPPTGWTKGAGVQGWSRSTQANRVMGGTGGSAKSGAIGDNALSWLQWDFVIAVTPGNYRVSFWSFTNCAAGDTLKFYFNGAFQTADSGHLGVEYPARYGKLVGVGATDENDHRTTYSQFDATNLDLVAPGASDDITHPQFVTTGVGSNYVQGSGTSFASPLVAGTGALMLSEAADRGFDLTSDEVGILLRASADKVGGVSYAGGEGTGGGYNAEYGYGRLDAGAAAQYVHFSRAELTGWVGTDIYDVTPPPLAGSSRRFEEIKMRSLRTSANTIGGTTDQCRFVSQDMSGNGQITALVNSVGGTSTGAVSGLMIRDGTLPTAKHAMVGLTGDGKATFLRRTVAGGATTTTNVSSISPPYWVRLARSSNTITASRSVNGTTWTTIGTVSLTLGSTYQIGLVATSGATDAALATGTLTDVEVLGPGIIGTIAGNGSTGSTGDGGPATSGSMARPGGMVFAASGNLYVAESAGDRIRKIDTAGIISTPIGTGVAGFVDNVSAGSAQFSSPADVAFDRNNRLYIADTLNQRIRRWDPVGGQVKTIAGSGTAGFSGDGGPALSAQLNYPHGVCVDASGRVYIAERSPNGAGRIRRIEINGNISTFAGGATPGLRGDGLPATQAWLIDPYDVVVDEADNVYIADTYDYRVRRVDGATGIITTIAGNGNLTFSGDGGAATAAGIGHVCGVAVAENGDVYLASETVSPVAGRIRKIDAVSGKISTVAGKAASGFSGDGGLATSATLNLGSQESQVVVHPTGALYISDTFNFRIRKVR